MALSLIVVASSLIVAWVAVSILAACPWSSKRKSNDVENPVQIAQPNPSMPAPGSINVVNPARSANPSTTTDPWQNPAVKNFQDRQGYRDTMNSVAGSVTSAKFLESPKDNPYINEVRRNENFDPSKRVVSFLKL